MSIDKTTGPSTGVVSRFDLASVLQRLSYFKPLIALVVLWEVVVQLSLIPEQALPHVYVVAETFVELTMTGELLAAAWVTIQRAILALALAVVVGVTLGLAMSQFRVVEWFFDPLVSILFPIPKVIFVPIYLLWFGFGTPAIVLLAATSASFPIVIATYDGANAVDRHLLWSARSMGLSKIRTIPKVVMPAALPAIFNGLNIALFSAIIVVLVSEMVTSGGGLGKMLVQSVRFFRTPAALCAVFAAIILGLTANELFEYAQRYTLRWTDEFEA